MIQRVFFDLGLTLAESDGPSHYVEHLAQLGYPITPRPGPECLPLGQ